MTRPYQPFLLRVLHSLNGLLVLGALVTGFWVYDNYDGRFGRIALPALTDSQGLHGTIGLTFLLFFPIFAIYSFYAGQNRLIQPDSTANLRRIPHPIGWLSLHRIINTALLIASVFALISGRLMKEEWLPNGDLDHLAYYLHLFSWLMLTLGLFVHILMAARVGGLSLILSIIDV
ncbi:MAG: cytochrome b/b6 domain-containing protein, partial [Elainella sp. Prado103]|nr:cytochrome b/b6 domain-containing protein [Elainella sp. Prado103]